MKAIKIIKWVAAGAALFCNSLAHAQGGVSIEFDTCVVKNGKYRMHFTAYQEATGGQEHCWDLPGPGKTILVFDFVDTEMRSKPVELRIVEVGEEGEIAVARLPPKVYPQGTVNLESEFEAGKRYMAVLTMSAAQQPVVLKAPIQVVPKQAFGNSVDAPPELLAVAKQPGNLDAVCSEFPCKDFSAYCYETATLSAADKANGVQDKAYLGVAFIWRHPAGEWFDRGSKLTLAKKAGTWKVVGSELRSSDSCAY